MGIERDVASAAGRPLTRGTTLRWVRRSVGPEIWAVVVGIAGWEALGRALDFPFFPPLSRVVAALVDLWQRGVILSNLITSIVTLIVGFGAAAVLGVALGLAMGRYRKVEYALGLYIHALLAAPSLVFVPVLFIFFGLSEMTRVTVVFLYSFFIIVVNAAAAVRTVDPALIEMGRVYGLNERGLLRRIILPNGLPLIMAGLRLGMGRAVKGMINAEMFIALVGLGAQVRYYGGTFAADRVLALLLVILAVALVFNALVQWADRRLTWWADGGHGGGGVAGD